MKIVLDTNCFLAILPKKSAYRPIFDAYRKGIFELIISTEILSEYSEIFAEKMTPEIADNLAELILKQHNTVKIEVYFHWGLITQDYDDNKFIDAAIASNADFFVTSDGHFKILKSIPFPKVKVISLGEFLVILNKTNSPF
ncbi:MAG: putative toxin-antitoxin system toxin component, PIN family [Spirosomaceae bacterium]|nr:putative toxin-antitoxin system toxin component, PIN family [Spirosomataceae bacterium]